MLQYTLHIKYSVFIVFTPSHFAYKSQIKKRELKLRSHSHWICKIKRIEITINRYSHCHATMLISMLTICTSMTIDSIVEVGQLLAKSLVKMQLCLNWRAFEWKMILSYYWFNHSKQQLHANLFNKDIQKIKIKKSAVLGWERDIKGE